MYIILQQEYMFWPVYVNIILFTEKSRVVNVRHQTTKTRSHYVRYSELNFN
jgi:capsular polysaccharide biosynthesis protein